MEAEVRLESAASEGCDLFAGCHLRLTPDEARLTELGEEEAAGGTVPVPSWVDCDRTAPHSSSFPLDTTQWRRYRIVRADGEIAVHVDGSPKLRVPAAPYESRLVRFGSNLPSVSHWRSVRARVENQHGHSIDWSWCADQGVYPDQFRRDRIVRLDAGADSGYSNWDQLDDGTIIVADYTNEAFHDAASRQGPQPHIKAYIVSEEELT